MKKKQKLTIQEKIKGWSKETLKRKTILVLTKVSEKVSDDEAEKIVDSVLKK